MIGSARTKTAEPHSGSQPLYRHILIATDGSALAEKAVAHGLALARAVGASVTALTVEVPLSVYEAPDDKLPRLSDALSMHGELMRRYAAQVLQRVAEAADAAGVPCRTLVLEHAHPSEAIVEAAADKGCDLIVMASHGRRGISAALLGSVTRNVLTHTTLPVLVCH
jgi:nucleotide-binding universal stress UspA family protein